MVEVVSKLSPNHHVNSALSGLILTVRIGVE
jgi:hypothetical protein